MLGIEYEDTEEYVPLKKGQSYVVSPSPTLILRYSSPKNSKVQVQEQGGDIMLLESKQDSIFAAGKSITVTSVNEDGILSILRRSPIGIRDGERVLSILDVFGEQAAAEVVGAAVTRINVGGSADTFILEV